MNKETLDKSKNLFDKLERAENILTELRSSKRTVIRIVETEFTKTDERPGIASAVKMCFRIMEMAWAEEHERLQKEFVELKP